MATALQESDLQNGIQALIVMSCVQTSSNHYIIQKILRQFHKGVDECQEFEAKSLYFGTDLKLNGFDLKIDNKYYSANIFLIDIKDKQLFNKSLSDSVNGVILYLDSNEVSSLEVLESSISYINQFDNQIKLLVCQTIDDIRRQTIEKWCLVNEFELVELFPQNHTSEDDFEDIDGITRISQAIEAYEWPNSQLKNPPQYNPSNHFKNLIEKDITFENNRSHYNSSHHLSDQLTERQDIEDFNHLFETFSQMKVKSSQMSETERKDYAEKVTLAFWKAIGGDITEIEDLEDSTESTENCI